MLTISAFILGGSGLFAADRGTLLDEAGNTRAARWHYAAFFAFVPVAVACAVMGASH